MAARTIRGGSGEVFAPRGFLFGQNYGDLHHLVVAGAWDAYALCGRPMARTKNAYEGSDDLLRLCSECFSAAGIVFDSEPEQER